MYGALVVYCGQLSNRDACTQQYTIHASIKQYTRLMPQRDSTKLLSYRTQKCIHTYTHATTLYISPNYTHLYTVQITVYDSYGVLQRNQRST